MKKTFRIATAAGVLSLGFLSLQGPASAASNCNVPQQNDNQAQNVQAQAPQNANVQELLKKYNIQVPQQGEQTAQGQAQAEPQPNAQGQAQAEPQEKAQAPQSGSSDQSQSQASDQKSNTDQAQGSVSESEKKVVELVNQEREKAGLKPLQIDSKLSEVAKAKSQDMKDNNYFDHQSPKYGSPFDMMKKFGVDYSSAGENIAQGQTSPDEVMNSWMNSEGHRKNIMNPNFTHIGVGYVQDGNYWTQEFISK
ncbi:CAP domain-containing protein [Priestia koreensis]|uniref:SCP domain-containing protein n=1 Tax=Priestia koreensis TaxID=284581 RepID=A0A0M0KR65_9BACI|nr:CAP domain-containing protein [Priestia koreensis]KOO41087.1 hypothetical protein AMD01_19240 [Priestia koreensis]